MKKVQVCCPAGHLLGCVCSFGLCWGSYTEQEVRIFPGESGRKSAVLTFLLQTLRKVLQFPRHEMGVMGYIPFPKERWDKSVQHMLPPARGEQLSRESKAEADLLEVLLP